MISRSSIASMVCRKIPYASRPEAALVAKRAANTRQRPYRCEICGHWHLTHLRRFDYRRRDKG